jgi:Kef-type K+ transport system membrane component KefB
MTTAILITLCSLLLIAYIFDITSSKTRIPPVILLLALGYVVRQLCNAFSIQIPDLTSLLPLLGTIGLILIVLEGSLELELNRSKLGIIRKSFIVALLPMLALAFGLAWLFHYFGNISFRDALTNAVPLSVISSAIAIPSVKYLSQYDREFIIYESSLSDIFGVIFFNCVALTVNNQTHSPAESVMQVLIMIAVSFMATIILAFLLSRIDHHIKFAPIILLTLLIYAVSKVYHLPGLIFILIFGIFLGNLDELKRFKWIRKLNPDELNKEVHKFRELITEATFLIRSVFFLLFGYLIETREILDTESLAWSVSIVTAIFLIRIIQFKLSGVKLFPKVFVAPRGLITILLFLSIVPAQSVDFINRSLLVQVILLTALVMMFGLMLSKKEETPVEIEERKIKADLKI